MRPMTHQASSDPAAATTPADLHADPHASDAMTGPHGSMDDHGADHGHDDHAHAGQAIQQVNLPAWGAGVLGVLLGVAVVIALAIASGSIR
jgi:hypothetical protein